MNCTTTKLEQQPAADNIAPGVPPLPNRRPRVREVSSRFMSPAVSSSSSSSISTPGDLHIKSPLPKHAISTPTLSEFPSRQQQQQQRSKHVPETTQSLDNPLGSHNKVVISVQRKQHAAAKLFKENGEGRAEQQHLSNFSQSKSLVTGKSSGRNSNNIAPSSRPDTPIVTGGVVDRIIPSRFRLATQNFQRQTNNGGGGVVPAPAATAAVKLLQSSGLSLSAQPPSNLLDTKGSGDSSQEATSIPRNPCSVGDDDADDEKSVAKNLPQVPTLMIGSDSFTAVSIQNSRTRSHPDMRSSMPDGDMLPTRLLEDRSCSISNVGDCHFSKFSASPCSRSLNLPLSSCEHSSLVHSLQTGERPAPTLSKRMGNLYLPPHPMYVKMGADTRKGRKFFSHQEEIHSLKLLHNHYLQWRYANAKAEASVQAQKRETERKLYSLGVQISDLRDAATRKLIEIALLQRRKTLLTILKSHMPYLDEWSALEEEYSTSLSGANRALLTSLVRLPVSGNVQTDIREVEEALDSAVKVMEMIGAHVRSFMPKAEEMDTLISELVRVIGGERSLIEECGDMLFKTHTSQVEDCSLRGHLMQLKRCNHFQPEEE